METEIAKGATGGGVASWIRHGCALVPLLLPCAPAQVVRADTIRYFGPGDNVGAATDCTNPNAPTLCTLRDALHAANSGDTLQCPPGSTSPLTLTLTSGPLMIVKDVMIHGAGLLTVDGANMARVI